MRAGSTVPLVLVVVAVILGTGCGRKVAGPTVQPTGSLSVAAADNGPISVTDSLGRTWVLDAWAVGSTVTLGRDGRPVVHPHRAFPLTQEFVPGVAPRDTVPAFSVAHWRWRLVHPLQDDADPAGGHGRRPAGPSDPGTFRDVTGGLGRTDTMTLVPGVRLITVDVPPVAGRGAKTLVCVVNFAPETWWAGPDPAAWPLSSDGENARAVDVTDWSLLTTSPAWPPDGRAYFASDSFRYLPSTRQPLRGGDGRGTFYEIYGNRIFARSEGDTVHRNSWVVLVNGGYDKDSKYVPRVEPTDPALPAGYLSDPVKYAVLNVQGLAGSPIGFRSVIPQRLTPVGLKMYPATTSMYPVYEPASVFRSPRLEGYWRLPLAGKAYALARAQDADGGLDTKVLDPIALADLVDAGGGTDAERLARNKVIVFHVDKAPALVRDNAGFVPTEGQAFPVVPGSCSWTFRLLGTDADPYDVNTVSPAGGGPTPRATLRFRITLYGKSLAGRDTSWTYLVPGATSYPVVPYGVVSREVTFTPGGTSGNPFASGDITVSIEICDCVSCETAPGEGRCVPGIDPVTRQVVNPRNVITVHFTRPAGCP